MVLCEDLWDKNRKKNIKVKTFKRTNFFDKNQVNQSFSKGTTDRKSLISMISGFILMDYSYGFSACQSNELQTFLSLIFLTSV